jgi:hypothetical protein
MRIVISFLLIVIFYLPVKSQKQLSQKEIEAKLKEAQKLIEYLEKKKKGEAAKRSNTKDCGDTRWTGSVNLFQKYNGRGIFAGCTREKHIDLSFTGAKPSPDHDDPSNPGNNDKGSGTIADRTEAMFGGKREVCNCNGVGQAILGEIGFHPDSTYSIYAIGPYCIGSGSGDGSCGTSMDITIPDQRLGTNRNILSATYTTSVTDENGTLVSRYTWNLKKTCPPWKDPYTEKRINTLNPKIKDLVSKFIKKVNDELCIQLRVAQGLRTIAEQNELYAQGRTKPGKIVTNAKGGESNHESGLAIDIYMVNCDGTVDLNRRVPQEVVNIAKQEGFEWGGDWKRFKDYPHFEMK